MSTDQRLSTESSSPTGAGAAPPVNAAGPARVRIVAAALALGAGAVAAMLLWRPWGERNAFGYGDVAPIRDNLWVGTLIDGFGFAVAAIALSLAVCLLVRDRGSSWANTGAVLGVLGGVAFAMGSFAHAALTWYATSDAISPAAGKVLLDYAEDHGVHVMLPAMAGFLTVAIAMLVLATALLRSRAVPRWLPISLIVLTLAQFGPIPGRALDFVQVALMGVLVALAATLFGRTRA